jgi:Do/DeqQ family serine protease
LKFIDRIIVTAVCAAFIFPGSCCSAFGNSFRRLERDLIATSEKVKKSVVHLEIIQKRNNRRVKVTGSGIIADKRGYILTNHHVVDKAEKIEVVIEGNKKRWKGEVIGSDVQTDLAVVLIDFTDGELPVAEFGDSDKVRVGEWAMAVGNPYGLEGTVSLGIISANQRDLNVSGLINEFIQTDAMIDQGSSGGPLCDIDGRVIGVNSLAQGRGIGFTIPINTALKVMREIIDAGSIERGWLGVTIQPLSRDMAEYFELPELTGVIVNSVLEDSPAEKAGLKVGDIISVFNGEEVEVEDEKSLPAFIRRVADTSFGTEVKIEIYREGKKQEISATIERQPKVDPDEEMTEWGLNGSEITNNIYLRHRLETRDGVFVSFVERGSPAQQAKIRKGDVIISIEETEIETIEDFGKLLSELEEREQFMVLVQRGQSKVFCLVKQPPSDEDEPTEANGAPDADAVNGAETEQ